jgi:hypothetical protein
MGMGMGPEPCVIMVLGSLPSSMMVVVVVVLPFCIVPEVEAVIMVVCSTFCLSAATPAAEQHI